MHTVKKGLIKGNLGQAPHQSYLHVLVLAVNTVRTSLVGQWLRLHTSKAGGLDSIPGQGTRSHMLQLRRGTAK